MVNMINNSQQKLYSSAKRIGELLTDEFKKDPSFYFFSPDETTSNKFDEILETRAGGVISSHCGPGTLGVLFIKGE